MPEPGSDWLPLPIALPAPGRSAAFRVGPFELLLCNADGTPYVIADRCPHARSSLRGGRLRGSVLECPLHGGALDVRDGTPVTPPIRRPVACFPVRRHGEGWQVALPPGLS